MKKFSVLSLVVSGAMVFSFAGFGCKKAEQQAQAPKQVEQAQSGAMEYGFEDGIAEWQPRSKKIMLELSDKIKHSGNSSLKISGSAEVPSWNYAASPKFNLEAGKNYKLTGWLLVESIDNPKFAPFLKCVISQNSKFLKDAYTNRYDLRKKDWQEFSVTFTTPSDSDIKGVVTVEKATKDVTLNATIYVDDLKIELVE